MKYEVNSIWLGVSVGIGILSAIINRYLDVIRAKRVYRLNFNAALSGLKSRIPNIK